MGAGRFLKTQSARVQLVGVQPAEPFHGIEGLKHLETAIVPPIYDASVVDRHLGIDTEEAFNVTRDLASHEGLFVGTSTGAAVAGALMLARESARAEESAVIVLIAPDNGSKYLSTGLWGPG
jgi:cysteine synthase B